MAPPSAPTSKNDTQTQGGSSKTETLVTRKPAFKALVPAATHGKKQSAASVGDGGGEDGERKRRKKKSSREGYEMYIHKILKQVCPDLTMSKTAMSIVNSFVFDIFERLAKEASVLAKKNAHSTITRSDIQTAVKLTLAGELGKHSIAEGTKSSHKYETYLKKHKK